MAPQTNHNLIIAAQFKQCATTTVDDNQQDTHLLPSNNTHDELFGVPSSDAESGADRAPTKLGVNDVIRFRTRLAHVFHPLNVHDANRAYLVHMETRPVTLVNDYDRFDPAAALVDELLSVISSIIGEALTPYLVEAVKGATPLELPQIKANLMGGLKDSVLHARREALPN